MIEIVFLSIAGSAAAFKAIAIIIGIVWAFKSLLTQTSAPLVWRHARAELPYRSGVRRC